MKKSLAASLFGAAVLLSAYPAAAKAPTERMCSYIFETEDGKFRYEMQMGWSLYHAQLDDGEVSYPEGVVAVTCMRSPLLLVPEDAETLRQGITIYLADPASGQTLKFEVIEGKVVHDASEGRIGKKAMKKLAKTISEIEAAL